MSDSENPRADYYVYLCRIGGTIAYVGKGSGWRVNRHLKTSHNASLKRWIERANKVGLPVKLKVIKRNLTNEQALRLESRCFRKWHTTITNHNDPWPLLEAEQEQAEWEAFQQTDEYASSLCGETDRWLEAVNAFYDGDLSREEAIELGFIDEHDKEYKSAL